MRDIPNEIVAAVSNINWLYSEIASVPLTISNVTNDEIRKIMGTADAIGEGSPYFLLVFANFVICY